MREAKDDFALQKRYLDFLRDLFKGAPYVDAVYMTGILPIKKYGQHSALNLFTEYSMADPDALAPLMGFNADEVERICAEFGRDFAEISRWYDVYALLVHLGYLGYDEVERAVFIPNEEIRREFANAVQAGARPQLAALVSGSRELQHRTLAGDSEYVAEAVEQAHASAAGPHLYNDEQALRAA